MTPIRLRRIGMVIVRHGLTVILVVAGILLLIKGKGNEKSVTSAAGVVVLGVALMVWMLGWLFRMSLASNEDRVKEQEARDYFTEHGHWPGEDVESAGADSIGSSAGGAAGLGSSAGAELPGSGELPGERGDERG